MNFSEKIQKLRKQNNLTQEELSEKLFISRTAISKWESGKGYPSIDILKQIAIIFNVSIDSLLSCEQILEIAEKDKQDNIKKNNSLFFATFDLLIVFLMVLPLYALKINNHIYSVSLFVQNDLNKYIKEVYIIGYTTIFIIGILEFISSIFNKYKAQKYFNIYSIIIHLIVILFLITTKEPYACILAFILFIFKLYIIFLNEKNNKK